MNRWKTGTEPAAAAFPGLPKSAEQERNLPKIFSRCELRPCLRRGWLWNGMRWREAGIHLQERWYCSLECFERALTNMLAQPQVPTRRPKTKPHRVPLGLVLLSQGAIREEQLRAALQAQRESGSGRVGEWLGRLDAATEQQITAALAAQWSCPVFPLERHRTFLECASLVPLPILETSRTVAVHWLPSSRVLHMAFADGIDYTTLYAIEQMLEYRTVPCLAAESAVQGALDELRAQPRPWEVVLDSMQDPAEIARMVRRYVNGLEARLVRLANCHQYLWIHLRSPRQIATLLFRLAPPVEIASRRGNGGISGRLPDHETLTSRLKPGGEK